MNKHSTASKTHPNYCQRLSGLAEEELPAGGFLTPTCNTGNKKQHNQGSLGLRSI